MVCVSRCVMVSTVCVGILLYCVSYGGEGEKVRREEVPMHLCSS